MCEIRGVRFSNSWEKIQDGLPIAFFRDADNVHDDSCIEARSDCGRIGRVAREVAAMLCPHVDGKRILMKGYVFPQSVVFVSILKWPFL